MRSDHTPTQRTCLSSKLTRFVSSLLSVWEQNLFSPKRSGKRGHAACMCLYPWPHLHCKRHDKTTRRDIIANKKERKKSTLHYLQLTSRACSARSSFAAASLPASSQCCLGVFKKKKKTMTFMKRTSLHKWLPTSSTVWISSTVRKKTC